MGTIAVQLNHPGVEKKHAYRNKFVEGKGYYKIGNQLIREWNNDDSHYRKLLRQTGTYVEKTKAYKTKNDTLVFWGEWEGYSKFYPLAAGCAKGIHEPFHSIIGRGCQNTDPYVFGDYFKYAICRQNGVMTELDKDSLILFGTTTNNGFLLDSVFVVKTWETAESVSTNNAINYSQTYKEKTLEQLGGLYLGKNPSLKNKIYHSRTWWYDENKDFFSYVPCKINNDKGIKKALIPFETANSNIKMSKQKIGHLYNHFSDFTAQEVWKYITDIVLKQGFYLGIRFDEPATNNNLARDKENNF